MARRKFRNTTEAMFGEEQSFPDGYVPEHYTVELSKLLNWYAGAVDKNHKKKWFGSWALAAGYSKTDINLVPDVYCISLGTLARIKEMNFPLNDQDLARIATGVKELVDRFHVDIPVTTVKKVATVNPIDVKLGGVMEIFDNFIDEIVHGVLQVNLPVVDEIFTKPQQQELIAHYETELCEVHDALRGKADYHEAFPWDKTVLNRLVRAYEGIIAQLTGAVKERAPRRRKVYTPAERVKKLIYQKECTEYKLVSIDPREIVGAMNVLVFNTKNRKLGIYHAADGGGISVKGSTLQGFKFSSEQKTVRKPNDTIRPFVSAPGKRTLELFNAIRAKGKTMTGRINKDTILLKVF